MLTEKIEPIVFAATTPKTPEGFLILPTFEFFQRLATATAKYNRLAVNEINPTEKERLLEVKRALETVEDIWDTASNTDTWNAEETVSHVYSRFGNLLTDYRENSIDGEREGYDLVINYLRGVTV